MIIKRSSKISASILCIFIAQSFLMKLSFIEPSGWISQVDEFAVLLSAVFFTFFSKVAFLRIIQLKSSVVIFSIYIIISLLSSLFGVVVLNQFLLQFSLDIKPFILIILVCMCFDDMALIYFERIIKTLIAFNVPFVIWQLLFSGSYDSVFSNGSHFGLIYSADGEGYSRAAGVFWFTGIYALFCALSIGFFVSKLITSKRLSHSDWLYLLTSVILLLLSLSRGEIVSCIISALVVYCLFSGARYVKPVTLIAILSTSIIVLIVSATELEKWLVELGVISGSIDLAPRAIFMQSALDISREYFPLGAGLGAFGGKAAVDYDSVFFYKYLISHEWYFNYGYFLTDTFWPKVIAETGFIGALFYLFGFLALLKKAAESKNIYAAYSVFAIVFILVNSLSAPVMNDAFSIAFVFFLFYGIFHKTTFR